MTEEVDFTQLKLPIPEIIQSYSREEKITIFHYLNTLNETQQIAYKIAVNHLGSSYNICRSNGYKDWVKQNEKTY